MSIKADWQRLSIALRRGPGNATAPYVLFPAIAILATAVLWGTTETLIQAERSNAESAAVALTRDLTETYESQMLRVLREMNGNFRFIQYGYQSVGGQATLPALEREGLLPSELFFAVVILDSTGEVVESTRPAETDIPAQEYLKIHQQQDTLHIAPAQRSSVSQEWKLQFSRRLESSDGSFAGVAVIEADAAFFVSSYESKKMGNRGVLALLGTDGLFRVMRVGDTVSAGISLDYSQFMNEMTSLETNVDLVTAHSDKVQRYLSARKLYDFPLAVVVGLSSKEQLAGAAHRAWIYFWRTAAMNLLVLLVVGVLWRMSYKLAESRRHEVEAQLAHAKEVEYLAYHDNLTGLPNRSFFSEMLVRSISLTQRNSRKLAVLFLDLDHFKYVNDTMGHDAGDQLLREVASRLKDCLRESDIVARLGGDEFVVLLPEISEAASSAIVARKIILAIGKPFILSGQEFRITASIGISTFPEDGADEETLTKNADVAMYKAKEEGKNNFQHYSEKLRSESLERLTLESSLRHAMERGELYLFYQAKRNMNSGGVTGVEALLRWEHPDLGIVAPMRFLPVAEEIGLIVPIGRWVLKTACEQNVSWQKQGIPRLRVAVNLSAQQFFYENLPLDVASVLQATGMDAELLELEVSEDVLIQNVDKTLAVLGKLKEMGVCISVDNFGAGYSSPSLLKRFPWDSVKIDRALIRSIADPGQGKILAQAVIALGRSLGVTVVAQGVETEEQVEFFRGQACDEGQGFYYNKPMPSDEFTAILKEPTTAED